MVLLATVLLVILLFVFIYFKVAKKTENYVGADIEAVCREAAMEAIRVAIHAKGNQVTMTMKQFRSSLEHIKARGLHEHCPPHRT